MKALHIHIMFDQDFPYVDIVYEIYSDNFESISNEIHLPTVEAEGLSLQEEILNSIKTQLNLNLYKLNKR